MATIYTVRSGLFCFINQKIDKISCRLLNNPPGQAILYKLTLDYENKVLIYIEMISNEKNDRNFSIRFYFLYMQIQNNREVILSLKRTLILTAYKFGEKSYVRGLNVLRQSPNWHIPQVAYPPTRIFWHISRILGV